MSSVWGPLAFLSVTLSLVPPQTSPVAYRSTWSSMWHDWLLELKQIMNNTQISIMIMWKILKEMGIPDYLTFSWEICMQVKKRQNWTWNNRLVLNRERSNQGCILSPCLFNLYAKYIMWNAGLDEAQAGIKIARRNSNNLRYADDTTLMAESKEEIKSLFSERGEWKSWLKIKHSEN